MHFGGGAVSAIQDVGGIDPVRDGLSIFFTMTIYTGYALMLVAAMALANERGHEVTPRQGIIWGIAGFVVVHFAPGFTLAPELPGVARTDVYDRQIWWFATAAATAVALWLIAFGTSRVGWGIAVVLLLAPHVIGAPFPDEFAGPAPTEIGSMFAARAFGVGMVAWVLTGLFAAYFWQRESQR